MYFWEYRQPNKKMIQLKLKTWQTITTEKNNQPTLIYYNQAKRNKIYELLWKTNPTIYNQRIEHQSWPKQLSQYVLPSLNMLVTLNLICRMINKQLFYVVLSLHPEPPWNYEGFLK